LVGMKNAHKTLQISRNVLAVIAALVLCSGVALAHHGSGISYDTGHLWTTWATVTEFQLPESASLDDIRSQHERRQGRALDLRTPDESVGTRSRGMDEEPQCRGAEARHQGETLHRHLAGRRT